MPNPILQRIKKNEARLDDHARRLDGHDHQLAQLHVEQSEQDRDIAALSDVIYRAKLRDRRRLAKRLRAARGRGR
ncbi:MAG: hypothetical protein ABJA82_09705 [Myxococcales bacterium]